MNDDRRPGQRDFGALLYELIRHARSVGRENMMAHKNWGVPEGGLNCVQLEQLAETAVRDYVNRLAAELAAAKGDPSDVRPIGWRFKYKESDDWNYTENAKAAKRYKDSEYFVQPVFEANAVKRWNDEWRASQQEVFDLQSELAAERQRAGKLADEVERQVLDAERERQRAEGIATTVERIHAVLKPGRPSHGLAGNLACILDHVSDAALESR